MEAIGFLRLDRLIARKHAAAAPGRVESKRRGRTPATRCRRVRRKGTQKADAIEVVLGRRRRVEDASWIWRGDVASPHRGLGKGIRRAVSGIGPATQIVSRRFGATDMRKGFNGFHREVHDGLPTGAREPPCVLLLRTRSRNRLELLFVGSAMDFGFSQNISNGVASAGHTGTFEATASGSPTRNSGWRCFSEELMLERTRAKRSLSIRRLSPRNGWWFDTVGPFF